MPAGTSFSSYELACTRLFDPTVTDVTNPTRYYLDQTNRPTLTQRVSCLSTFAVGNTLRTCSVTATTTDRTDAGIATARPAFIGA